MNEVIEIQSFNPYESRFPNRKVVTREILVLIKELRNAGQKVIVLPDDERQVEYLYRKGFSEYLTDPKNLFIATFASTVVASLLVEWIKWLADGKKQKPGSIFFINNTTHIINDIANKMVSKSELDDVKKKRKKLVAEFGKVLNQTPPYADLPFPILKNHEPEIVGWCRLEETKTGLEIADGFISDKTTQRKIKGKKYRGLSISGIASKSICNICKRSYFECNHIAGNKYGSKLCINSIHETDLVEVSVVKEPVNKTAFLKLLTD